MTSVTVSISDSLKEFVDGQISIGMYESVDDYVAKLIREDQKHKAQERLEELLQEGMNSGTATEMTALDWDELRARAHQRWEEQQKNLKDEESH